MRNRSNSGLINRLLMSGGATALTVALSAGTAHAAQDAYVPVTAGDLTGAATSDGWLMFNRDYSGRDYAPFTQVTTANVSGLKQVWASEKIDIPNGFEGSPIIHGDYMFVTTPKDRIIAYNATTGGKIWEYDYAVPPNAYKTVCCDTNNRGVAV